ncbi:MAG TPA: hypothetical protein VIT67_12010 [Povalibacter sp.]
MRRSLLFFTALVALLTAQAVADEEPVARADQKVASATELKFDDAWSARVEGRLVGAGTHKYTFNARKGQKVVLALSSELSPWIGIDLLAPVFAATLKDSPAVYTNFIDGSTRWEGVAPGNGLYTVRLGFLTSHARKVGRVDYELDVNLK